LFVAKKSMIYSLLVLSSPWSGQTSRSAGLFAQALLRRGHTVRRVFFMDEGCFAGAANTIYPQDEADHQDHWIQLARQHEIDLVLCISSAIKRGLLDETEAERYEKNMATIHPEFIISGLGQLVDAAANSDRLITFGG
jgi:tRNA 2-thiouridine synthesizing protein D